MTRSDTTTPDLLIENLSEVATAIGSEARRGSDQGRIERRSGVSVLCRNGRIEAVAPLAEIEREHGPLEGVERLDGSGSTLIAGFVDPHTHLPWWGSREEEFRARLAGKTYQEIAAEGGGILSTVRSTRAATEVELVSAVDRRLDRMLRCGTTTAEAKSGYGLSREGELKQLRAIARASSRHPVDLVPTAMPAHEIPPEHRDSGDAGRGRWIDEVVEDILPAIAESGLAEFCDVFCEQGVFSADESRRVLRAGRELGLTPRLHADEFVDSGGAELAAELGALSADHLIAVSPRGIEAMAASDAIATLLPGTSFFLMKHHYAPARRLIEAGVPVALATDCNPGSSHTESLATVVMLAVFELGLSIEEALTAATLNAAAALGRADRIGSVEPGKAADLVILDAPNVLHLAYHYGVNLVRTVIKGGRVVYREPPILKENPE